MSAATRIQQYALIVDSDPQSLVKAVSKAIMDGFQPVGGVAMVREAANPKSGTVVAVTQYAQALVKLRAPGNEMLVNGRG